MPGWPSDKFYRKTRHASPRHQLFQPGYNATNSCWLDGKWITVPKDEWERRRVEHDKMYRAARKDLNRQHYRDAGISPEEMTRAQRQAWEFYSGSHLLDGCHEASGTVGPVSVEFAGNSVHPKCADWLREEGWKIMRHVVGPDGQQRDQLDGFKVPDDLVSSRGSEPDEAVDTWKGVVEQNVANFDTHFRSMVEVLAGKAHGSLVPPPQYAAIVAFGRLIEIEELILSMEWKESVGRPRSLYSTIEKEKARYTRLRKELRDAITDGVKHGVFVQTFDELLEQYRASHNECARTNLDNSEGQLFCYVLPKFDADGSHGPWGPRDVPWAHTSTEEVSQ
jgi:hypothetical protein